MSDLPSNATPVTAVRESASAFNYLERQLGRLVAARSTSPESSRSGRSVRSGGGSISSRSPSPLMAVLTAVSAVTAVPEAVAVLKEIPDVPVSIPSRPVAAPPAAVAAEAIPVVPVSIPTRSSARPPGLSPPPLAPAPPPAPALAYMPPPPFPPLPRPQSMRQPVSLLKREELVKPAPVPVAQLVAQPVAPPVAQPVAKAHVGPIGWATRAQALAPPVKSEPLPVKQEVEPAASPLPTSPLPPSPVPQSSPAPEPQHVPEPESPATQTVPLLAPQPAPQHVPQAIPQPVDQAVERVNQVCQFVPPIVHPLLDRTAPRVSDYFQTPTGRALDQLSVEDICTLLHRIDLGQYADMFRAHKISGKFLACSDFYRDYEDLGMRTCLHGKYLLKCVQEWKQNGVKDALLLAENK